MSAWTGAGVGVSRMMQRNQRFVLDPTLYSVNRETGRVREGLAANMHQRSFESRVP